MDSEKAELVETVEWWLSGLRNDGKGELLVTGQMLPTRLSSGDVILTITLINEREREGIEMPATVS